MLQHEVARAAVVLPDLESGADSGQPLALGYSELASHLSCGLAYRLRTLIGFQPRLATELGYGKAVHHVLRTVAEITRATGTIPTAVEIDEILNHNFFVPTANKTAHRQLKDAAHAALSNTSPPTPTTVAEQVAKDAAVRLRQRDYAPNPGPICRRCEVRTICPAAKR